ncbi:hypothetical protein HK096_003171, partial [Nowakowskiella sp. JEL0078]
SDNFIGRFLVQSDNGKALVIAPNPDDIIYDDDSDTFFDNNFSILPSETEGSKKSGVKTGSGVHRVTVNTKKGASVLRFVEQENKKAMKKSNSQKNPFTGYQNHTKLMEIWNSLVQNWSLNRDYINGEW